jgi:hypothetical protein
MENPICLSCGRPDPDGLNIMGHCICTECETLMITSDAASAGYQHWIDSCRKIWEKFIPVPKKTE